jgi:hypothetical protein
VSMEEARALARRRPPTNRTAKVAGRIAAGVHPHNGLPLGPAGETCGSCKHKRRTPQTAGTYWKCDLGPLSRGPGTDLRVRWPACAKWEAP